MHKAMKEKNSEEQRVLDDHSISIMYNLCLYVDDTEFLRLVNKFKENTFEKFERLLYYHNKYSVTMKKVEGNRALYARSLEIDDPEELDLEVYSKKMEEG
jgi:hypothetical protein